jgi:hypothetical protein
MTCGALNPAWSADLTRAVPDQAQLQAHISLQALAQLTTAQTFKSLGFKNPGEAKSTTLGSPFRVTMIRLDQLRGHDGRRPAETLLEETGELRYPVYVGNELRTGVAVREAGGQWQVASVGRPELTKALVAAAGNRGREADKPGFIVTIPALNLYFIGDNSAGKLLLTPATNDSRFGLEAGKPLPAEEVLDRLIPYAKQMETGPRIAD